MTCMPYECLRVYNALPQTGNFKILHHESCSMSFGHPQSFQEISYCFLPIMHRLLTGFVGGHGTQIPSPRFQI